MEYIIKNDNVLIHHGIKGQKWGVRRFQNADGTLTEAGKKRQEKFVASNKEAYIKKGTTLYRISDNSKTDRSSGKIYVSTNKETGDFYVDALGSNKIYEKGKAYVHEYITNKDLKLPSKRVMEKIELGLLDDKKVQKELIDSLMKKGMSREVATKQVRPYSAGKAFVEKAGSITLGSLWGGFMGGVYGGLAGLPGLAIGGAVGAVTGGASLGAVKSKERERALNVARVSYGDKNNKVINETIRNELNKKGYNAMKDYNDRQAFGKNGKHAVIVFDSNDNLKDSKISELKSKDYAKAYARNYLKQHPESKLDFDDLVKDGEAKYKNLYESGVINREREKENKRLLENAKKSS